MTDRRATTDDWRTRAVLGLLVFVGATALVVSFEPLFLAAAVVLGLTAAVLDIVARLRALRDSASAGSRGSPQRHSPVLLISLGCAVAGAVVGLLLTGDDGAERVADGRDGTERPDEDQPSASATTTIGPTTSSTTTTTRLPDPSEGSGMVGYTPEMRAELMSGCREEAASLGWLAEDRCACLWDRYSRHVPIEEYLAFDAALEQDPDAPPPAWYEEGLRTCLPGWEPS